MNSTEMIEYMSSPEAPNNDATAMLLKGAQGIASHRVVVDQAHSNMKVYYGFPMDSPRRRNAFRKKLNRLLRRFDIKWTQGEDETGKFYSITLTYHADT